MRMVFLISCLSLLMRASLLNVLRLLFNFRMDFSNSIINDLLETGFSINLGFLFFLVAKKLLIFGQLFILLIKIMTKVNSL